MVIKNKKKVLTDTTCAILVHKYCRYTHYTTGDAAHFLAEYGRHVSTKTHGRTLAFRLYGL